jgi:hypothetical protein
MGCGVDKQACWPVEQLRVCLSIPCDGAYNLENLMNRLVVQSICDPDRRKRMEGTLSDLGRVDVCCTTVDRRRRSPKGYDGD